MYLYFFCIYEVLMRVLLKMLFIPHTKLFYCCKYSNFWILVFSISWHHHIPEYKTSNTFYWITQNVDTCRNQICLAYLTLQKKYSHQKIIQKMSHRDELHVLFYFRVVYKKESTVFQIALRSGGERESPLVGGIGKFCRGIFLLGDGNLTRSNSDHLNLFQR